ncbi:DMSO reductase anchor subunit [Mesorhizobium sp. J18]|uniref:dimethyl sulfoxide reductase anchor subunit family protein n=1 Tax=Mesorhizobium sp. J18 TaxID=935263 RepID=UPI00119C380C|nr:DmsC/YnfH family molybdoenzyme membrane anchor subunit [Mesorhizobium sp. J18]TWH01160.1 DMSO reductase anchor subunit [Mesorhizobium sp. J18]
MHPAFSIIVFTTASGMGYGLATVLGLGLLDPAALSTKLAHVLALGLIGAGLVSSTLHLGNPQRAWRAFSQWKSSWLSREGVMAVVAFVPLCISAWSVIFEDACLDWAGLIGSGLSLLTVYCTAMIYASLRSVDAWHTRLTPACYLLFALAGGTLFASFFASAGESSAAHGLSATAIALLIAAWVVKIRWRRRLKNLTPLSNPESATGLGAIGRVRLLERPHMTENYLTREMGFRIARKHAEKLFRLALIFGGAVPIVLMVLCLLPGLSGGLTALLLFVAVLSHALGILLERWLFFAEARHAVMNYYGGREQDLRAV